MGIRPTGRIVKTRRTATVDGLSPRDRARARLSVGTALSKGGRNDYAVRLMRAAIRESESIGEP